MHWQSADSESVYSIKTEGGFMLYAIIEHKNNTLTAVFGVEISEEDREMIEKIE